MHGLLTAWACKPDAHTGRPDTAPAIKGYIMNAIRLALLGASALSFSTAAFAQNANDVLFDEIVTTATKTADPETVQNVAVAVTAANAETLEALNVTTLEDLTFYAPNVVLSDIGTSRGTANFSIRGLGINSSIPSIDPTVGVFIDGQYLGQNAGVVFDTFDLESVEILRGPQGLLFGRNTTGGAVLVNTKNPTDEVMVDARVSVDGSLKDSRGGANYTYSGTVRGPIIPEKLNAKLAAYYNKDDGYFQNLVPVGADDAGNTIYEDGDDVGAADTFIIRGALDFIALDNINLLVKGEYFTSEGDGPVAQNRGVFERDSFDVSYDNIGGYENEIYTASARLDIDVPFGDGQITNILGWRDYDATTDGDIDALPAFLFHSTTELAQNQWSNELRYSGQFDRLGLTTGVFYFDQDTAYTEVRDLPPLSPLTFYGGGGQEHDVFGIFANVDFDITDQLIVTAGLRYSEENKEAEVTYVRPRDMCTFVNTATSGPRCLQDGVNALLSRITGGAAQEPNGFRDEDSWSNLTPKFGLQYFLNDDTNLYATYTKGFRSGGYNFRITNVPLFLTQVANQGGQIAFDEEEVDAFEIGAKYTSSDRRVIVNAAGFFNDISDMQREVNISSPTSGVTQLILNTADAEILGGEVEARFRATDAITLTGNLGLIDANYTEVLADISGDGVVNDIDEALELPRVPKATYGIGAIAQFGDFSGRVNFQHRDRTAYTDNNFGFIQAIDDLSASLNWQTPVEGINIGIYGRNLLDEVQAGGDTQVPFGGPLGNGVNAPFDESPAAGTFSPLKKGRVIGIELNISLDGDS